LGMTLCMNPPAGKWMQNGCKWILSAFVFT